VETDILGALTQLLLQRLDVGWTFLLLLTRHVSFLLLVPGIGGGFPGITIRYPAAVAFTFAAFSVKNVVPVPPDMGIMTAQLVSEMLLGGLIGLIPLLIVSGAQVAGHIASGTMGLNGAQLVDPTTQASLPDLARLYSDLATLVFLLVGGHYAALLQLSSLQDTMTPGTFMLSAGGLKALIDQSAYVFYMGCMIAAPVIVALLLTNFVMALISKAVPTVNLFIISFPLTIAVGLGISIIALPEVVYYLTEQYRRLEHLLLITVA
jgi:flagellar biosynthetic protein FliR